MNWLRNNIKNLILLFLSIIVAVAILEIFLKIYDPFEFRVKGDKIILRGYKKHTILSTKLNEKNDKLDPLIIHTKNSLGFRGEEPPKEFDKFLTMITVGGSTTECLLLSDNKDWTHLLGKHLKSIYTNIWINNAGIDGHSTFGHMILMEDYIVKLKPKMVLFLIGLNDIGLKRIRANDEKSVDKGISFASIKSFFSSIKKHSEIISLGRNIDRCLRAKARELDHHQVDLKELESVEMDKTIIKKKIEIHKEQYLNLFEKRLLCVIQIARKNQIDPIFITQPVLYGNIMDDITNVNLGEIKMPGGNGTLHWEILELYNNKTRDVGKRENVLVIDVANKMPKSSRYYYDFCHFTNEGAEIVAKIIYKDLIPFIENKYQNIE